MSWFTLSGAIFLNGVLLACASGAVGMNYRKNRIFNTGLAGIVYLGALISDIFGRMLRVNPYWSVPFCIIIGAVLNLALNVLYLDMMNKTGDRKTVNAVAVAAALLFYLFGKLLFSLFLNQVGFNVLITLKSLDFTLFRTPGVIIVGVTLLVSTLLLQFVLSPVVEERGLSRFDKWDYLVYGLAGASACLAGALYSFWFRSGPPVILLVVCSVIIGGIDKKLNPYLGGGITALFWVWLSSKQQVMFGVWVHEYSFVIPILLALISIPFFPKGIIGKIRSIIEHKY
jgi:branched-subunit amino acid ABC-type transport system permease component